MNAVDEEIGDAVMTQLSDGTVKVERADPLIRVMCDLADRIDQDGVITLDTAGEYRYRFERHESDQVAIYRRVMEGTDDE